MQRGHIHRQTLVMGILNTTPDSFSDGGQWCDVERAVRHAIAMLDAGADIIDVGGESTRPGAPPVDAEEELRRVVPVIEKLRSERPDCRISVDTYKAVVADAACEAGATIVNDVTAMRDPQMLTVAVNHGATLALMHMQGNPQTMQARPTYDDVVAEVREFLADRLAAAVAGGVSREKIWLDPGIGFGKTHGQNLELIRRIAEFHDLGQPLLLGTSRKSFIGAITGRDATDRQFGTAATMAWAVAQGVQIVRVHDVAEMVDVVRVAEAIRDSG